MFGLKRAGLEDTCGLSTTFNYLLYDVVIALVFHFVRYIELKLRGMPVKLSELQFITSFFLALPRWGCKITDMPPKRKSSDENPRSPAKKGKHTKNPEKKAKSSVKGP